MMSIVLFTLMNCLGQLDQRNLNGEESDTLKTGSPELDAITGGLNPVDLVGYLQNNRILSPAAKRTEEYCCRTHR